MISSFPFARQRGAALAVGLLFLLVLTIVGLMAVRMTTEQGRMAANFQFQSSTFQAAESALRGVVAEVRGEISPPAAATSNLLVESISTPPTSTAPTRSFALGPGIDSAATVRYRGQGPAPGYSLGAGSGSIVAHRFEINGQSNMASTNAQAEHLQGIERIGPGF